MTPGSDCPTGKEQFTAAGARERRSWWRARGDRGMQAYRCEHCGTYHLGHRRGGRRERLRARAGAR